MEPFSNDIPITWGKPFLSEEIEMVTLILVIKRNFYLHSPGKESVTKA